MNTVLKTSLIAGLLLITFQNSHANDSDNKQLLKEDITQQSTGRAQNVLPPPSPYFSSTINSFTKPSEQIEEIEKAILKLKADPQNIEKDTDVTDKNTLFGGNLKNRIHELETALRLNQNQTNDLVEELHATAKNADFENEMYEKTMVQLQEKITKLNDENKTLVSKHATNESKVGSKQSLLSSLQRDSEELTELKKSYLQRNEEVSSLKKQIAYFEDFREQSNTTYAKVKTLEDAYTVISQEAEELKKRYAAKESQIKPLQEENETQKVEIATLIEKLSSNEHTQAELNDLQSAASESDDNNVLLKSKIVELDDTNKTLKMQLHKMQKVAKKQTHKLGLLDKTTTELMALKGSYKARKDEVSSIKNDNEELELLNLALISRIEQLVNDANKNYSKMGFLEQSTAELTALKSAYKKRNDEATSLKAKIAKLEDTNKMLLSKITQLEGEASQNTNKLGLLDKSATELTALKSAYKERNDESAFLKTKIVELENSNKTLLWRVIQLEDEASQLGTLDQSTAE